MFYRLKVKQDQVPYSMSVLSDNHSASSQETHDAEAMTESPEEDEENPMKNPFTISPDTDIFSMRDKESKKAKAERERMKTMKIHEKMTYSTKTKAKQKGFREVFQKEEEEEARKQAAYEERLKMLRETLPWMLADSPLEKETFRDYLNGRREIFFLEYAMAIKREEIERMENIAKNEEREVEKAEYCLQKDAALFDEFLKEKQKNALQAMKIATKETAAKAKKIREIQAITAQIENLQSDISIFKNTLREYMTYRDFIYQLYPKEWQKEHGKEHRKEEDLETASKAHEERASPASPAEQGQDPAARTNTAIPYSTSFIDVSSCLLSSKRLNFKSLQEIRPQFKKFLNSLSRNQSSLEDAESETGPDQDEESELYFTDPKQLLTIFTEMEEEILSFIQNPQEVKKSLDKVITTHESMDKKIAELKQQAAALKSSIAKEEERAADLELKVHFFSSGEYEVDEQDKALRSLKNKVLEVYCHCTGENEANEPNLEIVQMLMVIEKHLNDSLDNLERIPPEKREKAVKAEKKERWIRLREVKLRQQKQQQEERLQRTLERSQATTAPAGRRLIFRSKLPARKKEDKHSQEQMDKEKEEQLYYFT